MHGAGGYEHEVPFAHRDTLSKTLPDAVVGGRRAQRIQIGCRAATDERRPRFSVEDVPRFRLLVVAIEALCLLLVRVHLDGERFARIHEGDLDDVVIGQRSYDVIVVRGDRIVQVHARERAVRYDHADIGVRRHIECLPIIVLGISGKAACLGDSISRPDRVDVGW